MWPSTAKSRQWAWFQSTPLFQKLWPNLVKADALDALAGANDQEAKKQATVDDARKVPNAAIEAGVAKKSDSPGGLVVTRRDSEEGHVVFQPAWVAWVAVLGVPMPFTVRATRSRARPGLVGFIIQHSRRHRLYRRPAAAAGLNHAAFVCAACAARGKIVAVNPRIKHTGRLAHPESTYISGRDP